MKIQSEKIEMVDIHKIVPNPRNANIHPPEQIDRLCKLIEFQGFRNPLIVSNRSKFLVVGHGRLEAAKKLGMEKVPVIYQDFESEAQEYAYVVSDNEIARWANLDNNSVFESLKEIEIMDLDFLGVKNIEAIKMPDFEPVGIDEQGKLDELEPKMIECPNCGEEFDQRKYEK